MCPPHDSAKTVTRRAIRDRRRRRSAERVAPEAILLAEHLVSHLRAQDPEGVVGRTVTGRTVAVYTSLPGEPSTEQVRRLLRERGHRVLLPVLLGDRDLDWVADDGTAEQGRDPLRPTGDRLGPDAVLGCDAVLLPALAVDGTGTRLGQGGGSYDRALARLDRDARPRPAGSRPLLVAVVHDEEVLDGTVLTREPHDVPVDAVLTPAGLRLLG